MACNSIGRGGVPSLPPHKRGDTYSLSCVYKENGVPVSVEDFDIRSQIRDGRNQILTELVVEKGDQTSDVGLFYLTPTDPDTTLWPTGTYYIDIQFSKDGVINSSQTMIQKIIKDITQ